MDDTSRKSGTPTEQLAADIARMGPQAAAAAIEGLDDAVALEVLQRVNPYVVSDLIPHLPDGRREQLLRAGPAALTAQWALNATFPEDSIGRLMEVPAAVFGPAETVGGASLRVKELVKKVFVTYCFICDESRKLLGLVTMRDLLISSPEATLAEVMLKDPFVLRPEMPLVEAMKRVLNRHFPSYPVVDGEHRLIGLVRGQAMFEEQAYEISAQAGSMVGVQKEERLATPTGTSFRFRHPWLQLNLLTAFIAAAVVGFFQDTIDKIVILALFLPVLAGQSGNTGCQALAVTLRGMTLGELKSGKEKALVLKEALLGSLNGFFVGLVAGGGMYVVAWRQKSESAMALAWIVVAAMVGSCVVSGIAGAMIPLLLRRLGFDPATASSIFLTTATDVVSMGLLLGLATILLR
ncbi:MAG: magnesium transporter [Candidatus Brocadiae bacterium]|nr:magnesium transporter [Candidatus Brocadiia bacterium]